MSLTFAIDSNTMTNQPAEIAVRHRRPPEDTAMNGGVIGPLAWDKTRTVVVTWRDDVGHTTLAELVTARNGDRAHTITWNDPNGTSRTVKVDWAYDPDYSIVVGQAGGVFGDITLELPERPD